MSSKFVAVDLGASSGRVMLGGWDGSRFSLELLHRFPNAPVAMTGGLYWNVLGIWSQILDGLRKFRAGGGRELAGIGVDAWGVDFALLDGRGKLIGNPVSYRDSRTNGIPAQAFQHIGEAALFEQTGVATMQINTLFQLYSMVTSADPHLGIAQTLLTIPDLFLYLLCGAKNIEYTEATTTQMYSAGLHGWSREVLGKLGIPEEVLAPVVASGTVVGEVDAEVVRAAGFLSPFPAIAVASHDTASAVAAVSGLDESSAFLSSGTWSLMGLELDHPLTTEAVRRSKLTNEGGAAGRNLLLRNLTGLWIVQECQRQWEREGASLSWRQIVSAAEQAGPAEAWIDPNDFVFQSPGDMPAAMRAFCQSTGQKAPVGPGQMARCAFESLAFSYRSVLESLGAVTGRQVKTIRVIGGGSQNHFLCQMIADTCGVPVVAGPVEASALGNIMLQAMATGLLSSLEEAREAIANSVDTVRFEPHPDPSLAGVIDRNFARFEQLLGR